MTKRTGVTLTLLVILLTFTQPAHAASSDSWLCRIFGIGCPDPNAPPPFVPTYEPNVALLSPFGAPRPLNEWYFATQTTADEVCKRLTCQSVFTRPQCSMGGGPNTCTAVEREIVFSDLNRNAGIYASYWTRNPEDQFPGLALKLARLQLAAERNSLKRIAKAAARSAKRKKPATP